MPSLKSELKSELKEAVEILKRVYLLATIPNADGQDHMKIQESLSKLDAHVNELPEDTAPSMSQTPGVPNEATPRDQPADTPETPQAALEDAPSTAYSNGYADSGAQAPAESPAPTA